jgi:hypothetical protein
MHGALLQIWTQQSHPWCGSGVDATDWRQTLIDAGEASTRPHDTLPPPMCRASTEDVCTKLLTQAAARFSGDTARNHHRTGIAGRTQGCQAGDRVDVVRSPLGGCDAADAPEFICCWAGPSDRSFRREGSPSAWEVIRWLIPGVRSNRTLERHLNARRRQPGPRMSWLPALWRRR